MIMKNTKKNSVMKKILPSACMLATSAAMLSTSTYAWFSMNTIVTATGMSVTAKSDSTFLLIKSGTAANAAAIQTAKLTSDNAVTASAVLYPTAHDNITATAGITAIEAADTTNTTEKDIWFYEYSNDPNSSTADATTKTYVPVANFDNYVLVNEFSLAVADGSNSLSDLQVKDVTITPSDSGDQAVKVLVAGANGCEEFSATGNGSGVTLQTAPVTSSSVSTVKIYVYWDGDDTDVYTNGITDLKSTAVTVRFTGTVVNS
jgi:hypothetical protein